MIPDTVFEKGRDDIKIFARLSTLIGSLKDGKKYVITVKEYRKKRSLDANAYCWVLIDRLAKKTRIDKADIYRRVIKEIGGVSETICVRQNAADKLIEGWCCHGLGWQAERLGSKLDGCVNVTPSVYDTAQMSRLIDGSVQECQAQGIETMTPYELEQLKASWRSA